MSLSIDEAIKKVLSFLESIPLAPATVRYYSFCCGHVKEYYLKNGLQCFTHDDAARFAAEQIACSENGEFIKTYALVMRKAAYYIADCFASNELIWKRNRYKQHCLCDQYQMILDSFEESLSGNLSEGSVYNIVNETRRFLSYLESTECTGIQNLTAEMLRSYVIREAPKHTGNFINLTWPLKRFIEYLQKDGLGVSINTAILLANPVPSHERVLDAFDSRETASILESIDTKTVRGKRDYAIVMLALETGLRWSDIAKMELPDISWENRTIRVRQEKTGTSIILPLTVKAGNAVAKYILEARPRCDSPYIFVRLRRPYEPMLSSATPVADIMRRYYKTNGIEHHFGDGKTFHGLRRTMGTNLVKSGIPLEEVSQILGHRSINSARHYISLHEEMLAECCMDIGPFATRKEGLT